MAGDGGTTPEGALATRDSDVKSRELERPSFANPIQEIKAYVGMGEGFYVFDQAGIGIITAKTVFSKWNQDQKDFSTRELLHPISFRTDLIASPYDPLEIKGKLGSSLITRISDPTSEHGYKLDQKDRFLMEPGETSQETVGVPGIDYTKLKSNFEKQLEQGGINAKVTEEQEKASEEVANSGGVRRDRYAPGTNFFQVDFEGNTLRIYPSKYTGPKTIVAPDIRMLLRDDLPLEKQYETYQRIAVGFLKSLSLDNPAISFHEDPDNLTDFMNTVKISLEKQRASTPKEQIENYLAQTGKFELIQKSESEDYKDRVARLEAERKKFFESAEQPDITQQLFPYVAVANFDMACEPYLPPDQSERFTMGLARTLEDLGLSDISERVVKRMYANITDALHPDESVTYELLTPSPKLLSPNDPNFSTSVGSTHNDIYETQDIRKRQGANYLPYPEEETIKGGARGVILETISGKRYAIWEHEVHVYKGGAEGFTEESGDRAHVLDPKLANDLEVRYGIKILGGNLARDLLNKTVWREFTTNARKPLIEAVEKKYGPEGEQLSVTERLRKLTQLQAGVNAFEKDEEKDN